ncbi:Zinc finger BED domain-containing protein RICESLEEPER 2 [Linum perenne]
MVVTCHFMDENWRLQKCLLDFCAVPPPHFGLVISDALHKFLVDWNLEKKVWTITMDNATSNDVAMRTLKDEDLVKVSHVRQFLEVFSYVTTLISGSSYPTTNIFLPELWSIKRLLKQTLGSSITSMRTMAAKILEKFDKYWGQCNLVVSFAIVLDPTNKFTIIYVMYPDLYDSSESSYYIGLVREKLTKLYDEYDTEFRAKNNENPTEHVRETTSATSIANVQFKVLRGKAAFDSIVQKQVSTPAGKSELDKYLESDIFEVPTGSEFDVIGWWKEHSLQYKILSRMDIDILAIPITLVASEAAFSAGGRVIDSHRASLG